MAGTREGGFRAAIKNLEKDPNYYSIIGKKGGSAPHTKPRGFAANKDLARIAGVKGGRISRRRPKVTEKKGLMAWLKRELQRLTAS